MRFLLSRYIETVNIPFLCKQAHREAHGFAPSTYVQIRKVLNYPTIDEAAVHCIPQPLIRDSLNIMNIFKQDIANTSSRYV